MDPYHDGASGSDRSTGAQTDVGHGRIRKWPAAAAAAVLFAALQVLVQVATATPAAAVSGVFTVTAFTPTNSAHSKYIDAYCPLGSRLLGGGAMVDDWSARQVPLTWSGPYRTTDPSRYRDRWEGMAAEPTTGFAGVWRLTVIAICGPEQPGLEMVSTRFMKDTTFQAGSLACPAGKRVLSVGGGVTNWDTVDASLQLVRPDGALTIGRVTARQGAAHYPGQWYLYINVLCVNPIAGLQNVGTVVSAAEGHAYCPAGTSVVATGGGGGLSDSGPYYLQAVMPHTNLNGAYAAMTGTPTSGLVAQATCAS